MNLTAEQFLMQCLSYSIHFTVKLGVLSYWVSINMWWYLHIDKKKILLYGHIKKITMAKIWICWFILPGTDTEQVVKNTAANREVKEINAMEQLLVFSLKPLRAPMSVTINLLIGWKEEPSWDYGLTLCPTLTLALASLWGWYQRLPVLELFGDSKHKYTRTNVTSSGETIS